MQCCAWTTEHLRPASCSPGGLGEPAQGERRSHRPIATQSAGFRRLLQDPQQPDAGSETDPDGEPGAGGDQSVKDPGAPAPAGDSEGSGVEQESPDLLRGACTNHGELLGSAQAITRSVVSQLATLQADTGVA